MNMDFGLELGRPEVTLRTRSVTGSVTLIPAALPLSASRDSETLQVRRVLLLIVLNCDLCSCMFTLSHYNGTKPSPEPMLIDIDCCNYFRSAGANELCDEQ